MRLRTSARHWPLWKYQGTPCCSTKVATLAAAGARTLPKFGWFGASRSPPFKRSAIASHPMLIHAVRRRQVPFCDPNQPSFTNAPALPKYRRSFQVFRVNHPRSGVNLDFCLKKISQCRPGANADLFCGSRPFPYVFPHCQASLIQISVGYSLWVSRILRLITFC